MTVEKLREALATLLQLEGESRRRGGGRPDQPPPGADERPQALPAGTIVTSPEPAESPTVTA